jgi:hypothetical protein
LKLTPQASQASMPMALTMGQGLFTPAFRDIA